MASIRKEIAIQRSRELVWDAIRDVGQIHKRLVPGFVVDCQLEGDWRTVTFGNGMVVRELIVDVNDEIFRHAWSVRSENLIHHNAFVEVLSVGLGECRVVWTADLMPNDVAESIAGMIEMALKTMKQTFESLPQQ